MTLNDDKQRQKTEQKIKSKTQKKEHKKNNETQLYLESSCLQLI